MSRLSQTAVAVGLAATGLLFALRLLLRAIDEMTSFPTPSVGEVTP